MNSVMCRSKEQFDALMNLLPNTAVYESPCAVLYHVEGDDIQHFEVVDLDAYTVEYWIAVDAAFRARNCPRSPTRQRH